MKRATQRYRRPGELDNALKFLRIYHKWTSSANLLGLLLGTAAFQRCLGEAYAADFEILAGGELQFGLTTVGEVQLSDGEGDRGYAFLADSELYLEADVSPSGDLTIGAEVVLNADDDVE